MAQGAFSTDFKWPSFQKQHKKDLGAVGINRKGQKCLLADLVLVVYTRCHFFPLRKRQMTQCENSMEKAWARPRTLTATFPQQNNANLRSPRYFEYAQSCGVFAISFKKHAAHCFRKLKQATGLRCRYSCAIPLRAARGLWGLCFHLRQQLRHCTRERSKLWYVLTVLLYRPHRSQKGE